MECFKLENVSFLYPNREEYAIKDVSISVGRGEFVTVCGLSGSGKSTLLRMLKPALTPNGTMSGAGFFCNEPLSVLPEREQAEKIGFLMQSAEEQLVTDKVWHELAFGLENLGYSNSEIKTRVSENASFFGMEEWFHKEVSTLSGGQKQILNLASIMAMQPEVLILDEPTAQLDPISAQEFLKMLEKINRELGVTVILSEHRLEEVFPLSDRVILLDAGNIIFDGTPKEAGEFLKKTEHPFLSSLPTPMRIHAAVKNELDVPITVRDGRAWLDAYAKENTLYPERILKNTDTAPKETAVSVEDVWFRYGRDEKDVLKGLTLQVAKGEILSIVGGNGAGKSTLLSLISGINRAYRGKISIDGKSCGMLSQNVKSMLSCSTVFKELLDALENTTRRQEEKMKKIEDIASFCDLEGLLEHHPYDLSGGEQERLGLAKALLTEPEILLLDEPTKGMDVSFKENLGALFKALKKQGITIIMVSHDIEFCATVSDRCAFLFDGAIASIDDTKTFFAGKTFYTTSANRMARHLLSAAVTAEDVILACGGSVLKKEKTFTKRAPKPKEKDAKSENPKGKHRKINKKMFFSLFLILLCIPATILGGMTFFGDRKYYFISLLVVIEAMLPFLLLFEGRKPKAREVVLISVLCAICVAGRAAFFMLPQFKPTVALVIIAGICFGGETGFLVGAITAFVSNFLFGQGAWTPWQMFALGAIGFIAGLLFKAQALKRNKWLVCVFGFFATLVIYGGIMNPLSVLQTQANPTPEMFFAVYLSGFPFDLIHASATLFFLRVSFAPMMEKLERIRIKYGLLA